MNKRIKEMIDECIQYLKQTSLQDLENFISILKEARESKKRLWLTGNGGSCALCIHFSSDLENLGFDTKCLCVNSSRITALTNDIGWEFVYVKQLENFKKGDILILASVHGGGKVGDEWSQNLLLVAIEAKKKGGKILSLIGCDGGRLKEHSDVSIIIPSDSCCYVEGFHSLYTHIICEKLKEKEQ